jgi:hypothetical protein
VEPTRKIVNMLLALVLCGSGACASTITYSLSGTLTDGAALSGTMTINNVAGLATAANFILGPPDSNIFSVVEYDNTVGSFWLIQTVLTGASPGSYPSFSLVLPTNTLVGYGGGSLCSVSSSCGGIVSGELLASGVQGPYLQSGSASNVPEPATFLMLVIALPALIFLRRFGFRDALGT